ncbi:aromatic amino acid lyase, partial [Alkaliphilus pronyensis]
MTVVLKAETINEVIIGNVDLKLEEFIAIARFGAKVEFSDEYCKRVLKARSLVEKWTKEGRVMYGITTGFGALCNKTISEEETAKLQKNIVLSHATSVGEPLSIEEVRG